MRISVLGLLLALPLAAGAATPDAAATKEIEHLLGFLEQSDCRFNRNGSWHSGAEAADHLRGKYDYLLDKGQLDSTEAFIDKAASASSMSGKAYRVACPGQAEQRSSEWFRQELTDYRRQSPN